MEDVIVPFSDAVSIVETLLMFTVLGRSTPRRWGRHLIDKRPDRGGHGARLGSNQIKLTVILPNSVRTTCLP